MAVIFSLFQKEKKSVERDYRDREKQLAPNITEVVSLHHYTIVV